MNVIEQTYKWLSIADQTDYTEEELLYKSQLILSLLKEEIEEFEKALVLGDRAEQINACSDLLVVASNLPYFAKISLSELKQENDLTFESNMTKFCKTPEEALLSKTAYATGEHPNKPGEVIEVDIHNTGNEAWPYVLKTPKGKIMKSINFKDVERPKEE